MHMKNKTRFIAAVLTALLICSTILPSSAASFPETTVEEIKSVAVSTIEKEISQRGLILTDLTLTGEMFGGEFLNNAGTTASDWFTIAALRFGYRENKEIYSSALQKHVTDKYKTDDLLGKKKATEWHRISLCLSALGADPTDIDGINLIADGTYYRDRIYTVGAQGINEYIWALITLDSLDYTVPDDASVTRDFLIENIIKDQKDNGAYSLTGPGADSDLTAMAVTSLSPYYDSDKQYEINGETMTVKDCVDLAMSFLSSAQNENGCFSSYGVENAETTAQVIVALCSLGIDPEDDARFIKGENSLYDGLMRFYLKDGGFAHDSQNQAYNSHTSAQCLLALCAIARVKLGMNPVFDFEYEEQSILEDYEPDSSDIFDAEDLELYNSLPDVLSTEYYPVIITLYNKLLNAANASEYRDILSDLLAKKQELEELEEKIEDINFRVNSFLEQKTGKLSEKKTADGLVQEINSLEQYDREKIQKLDLLLYSCSEYEMKLRSTIITCSAVFAVIILCAALIIRVRIRKKKKQADNEED